MCQHAPNHKSGMVQKDPNFDTNNPILAFNSPELGSTNNE